VVERRLSDAQDTGNINALRWYGHASIVMTPRQHRKGRTTLRVRRMHRRAMRARRRSGVS
jgi:hypothetical protein